MKIALLNPPGQKTYIRQYFCSQVSKTGYYPQPIDFIMLSAQLSKGHTLFLIDAIKDRMSINACLQRLMQLNPEVVVFLSGMLSWAEDAAFVSRLKEKLNVIAIGIGDIFLEEGKQIIKEHQAIDALLMDFCNKDIVYYLEGEKDKIANMIYRQNNQVVVKESKEPAIFEIPIPRHDLFIGKGYSYPFVRRKNYASVLTDYGCPYKCLFCVMGTLNYKYRLLENILIELDYLKHYGVKEIFFVDQSFGVLQERNIALYKEMIRRNYNFGWVCYSRVDLVNDKILGLMKQAGCHTIMFGVETANAELLKKYNKGYTPEQIEDAFKMCRKLKLRTVGTFILGLPEDTKETCYQTIGFAKKIQCDFASFNFAVPRAKTGLRIKMMTHKLVDLNGDSSDQGGTDLNIKSFALSSEELAEIKRYAVKNFYLRPNYILKHVFNISSIDESYIKIKNGLGIIKSLLFKK